MYSRLVMIASWWTSIFMSYKMIYLIDLFLFCFLFFYFLDIYLNLFVETEIYFSMVLGMIFISPMSSSKLARFLINKWAS